MNELAGERRLPGELPVNPMQTAADWLAEAMAGAVQRNPNSMTLATLRANGNPAARIVLAKELVADPGYVVFYTNYDSDKGRQLAVSPLAAGLFHWDALGRQVRIEGPVRRSPADESDRYFATRNRGSQIGAWGSDQSRPVASRRELIEQVRERAAALGAPLGDDLQPGDDADGAAIPRPPHWGGYRLIAQRVELWVEGVDRIHDRAVFERSLEAAGDVEFRAGPWTGTRLQP